MGGGTVGLMCQKFDRNYIGSEISEKYVNLAETMIMNEKRQLKLF